MGRQALQVLLDSRMLMLVCLVSLSVPKNIRTQPVVQECCAFQSAVDTVACVAKAAVHACVTHLRTSADGEAAKRMEHDDDFGEEIAEEEAKMYCNEIIDKVCCQGRSIACVATITPPSWC